MNPKNGIGRAMTHLVILILICFLAVPLAPWGTSALAEEPSSLRQEVSGGPTHTGTLVNLKTANTTNVLIVTGGYGPLTGISPIQEKDFWSTVLSEIPGIQVDWFDGVPTSALLNQYALVIYDAGGYWYPLSNETQPLRDYHFSGKPLIVVTPDINYDWYVHGEPVQSFCTDVLHINGILGILPESTYQIYANTGHEILFGIIPEVVMSVPAVTSWPDCFDPQPTCTGVLTNGLIPSTEFGVGTCSALPSYSQYDPAGHLFAVVAYPGSTTEGITVTYGFPISGLLNSVVAKQLAKNSILFCLSNSPATYNLQVTPSSLTPKVDEVVTFSGLVTDGNGNPVPNMQLGIEDPIAEMSKLVATGVDGHFTYSVKANRAGDFRFLFFVEGIPTECLIKVERLGADWSGQTLFVNNPSEDSYQITVYVDGSLEGSWVIDQGGQQSLWQAPDSLTSYDLNVLLENLSNGEKTEAVISSYMQFSNTYVPVISDIPGNPSLNNFIIQSTDFMCSENTPSTKCCIQSAIDQPTCDSTNAEAGSLKVEASLEHGKSVEAKPYVEAGCSAFAGVKAKCELSCSAGIAPLKIGFCLGLCLPIEPFIDLGCGFTCDVSVGPEVGCSVAVGFHGQAGYEAAGKVGVEVKSPVLVSVVDPLGRVGGYIQNIAYDTNFIPGASYSGPGTEPQTVNIPNSILGDYRVILSGVAEGPYTLTITRLLGQETVFTQTYSGVITTGEVLESKLSLSESNGIVTIEVTGPEPKTNQSPVAEAGPDQTVERISVGGAEVTLDGSGSYDPDGDPLTYNWTWDGGPASGVTPTVTMPMGTTTVTLGVSDGALSDTDTVDITVEDTTAPTVTIEFPTAGLAVQDGIVLKANASDLSGVAAVYFYIREPDGAQGKITSPEFEDLPATFNSSTNRWEYDFDTLKLPDGNYLVLAKAVDTYNNEGWSTAVSFSIRNWAVITLLPSTPNNKAGRTMPVKFALRVASSVNPAQPFVWNDELTIKIFGTNNPGVILQTATFGPRSKDYRIDNSTLYITNFQTSKVPKQYTVEIWRTSKNWLVGNFTFATTK